MVTLKHKLEDGEMASQHFHCRMITVLCLLLVEHLPVLVLPRTFSTEQHFENFIWLAEQEIRDKISQTEIWLLERPPAKP